MRNRPELRENFTNSGGSVAGMNPPTMFRIICRTCGDAKNRGQERRNASRQDRAVDGSRDQRRVSSNSRARELLT